jgi:hypothetical protein
MMKKREKV